MGGYSHKSEYSVKLQIVIIPSKRAIPDSVFEYRHGSFYAFEGSGESNPNPGSANYGF